MKPYDDLTLIERIFWMCVAVPVWLFILVWDRWVQWRIGK